LTSRGVPGAMAPPRSGILLPDGLDAMVAPTPLFLDWLRARGVPAERVRDVEGLDRGLRGEQRDVLRYGLLKALVDKGYDVPRDEAAWQALCAAMEAALRARHG
jgi:hypothetical protein